MQENKDLEIIIPTFNRSGILKQTLQNLLNSPVRNCQITILDNNSTDDTCSYIQTLLSNYSNLRYIRNRYNLGLAGNFCKGMMLPTKKYFWLISDDTLLDFTHWEELQKALQQDFDVLLTLNYYQVTGCKNVTDKANIILMLIWMFSGIFKTELLSDDIILKALTDIYTVHPQIPLIAKAVTRENIYIPKYSITKPQTNIEIKEGKKYSFNRNDKFFHFRISQPMNFLPGFLNAVESIEDQKLKKECINLIFKYKIVKYSRAHFRQNPYHKVTFCDTLLLLPLRQKFSFLMCALRYYLSCLFLR